MKPLIACLHSKLCDLDESMIGDANDFPLIFNDIDETGYEYYSGIAADLEDETDL